MLASYDAGVAALDLVLADDEERLVCERVYGDTTTVMQQLGLLNVPEEYAGPY